MRELQPPRAHVPTEDQQLELEEMIDLAVADGADLSDLVAVLRELGWQEAVIAAAVNSVRENRAQMHQENIRTDAAIAVGLVTQKEELEDGRSN